MKLSKFHIYFSFPLLLLLILVTGFFVMTSRIDYASSALGDNLAGHSWDDYYGWGSYNSCNSGYTLPLYPVNNNTERCWVGSDWGWNVTFNTDSDGAITGGELDGFMWHDNLGWICLGATCASNTSACGTDITPPAGSLAVTFTGAGDSAGWAELSGWGKVCAWGDAGDSSWISFNCSNTNTCGSSDYGVYVNVNDFTLGAPVAVDVANRGYAWNGYSAGSDTSLGFGFMQFSPDNSIAHRVHFETRNGDVYSAQSINAQVGLDSGNTGDYNAMYLILANGSVTNFTTSENLKSSGVSDGYIRTDVDFGGILQEDTPGTGEFYYNQLGFLDVQGIENGDFSPTTSLNQNVGGSLQLNGYSFIRNGDMNVTSPLVFQIANGSTSGAGTILVKGDLYINSDITYENNTITNLVNLPSASFIVLGDVIVDTSVTNIDANFFVLGNGNNCPANLETASAGCGRFSTGDTDASSLTINGMVMAKQFNLQRDYTDAINTPAELFNFDGRLLANPSPGFADFSTNFPKYEENVPF